MIKLISPITSTIICTYVIAISLICLNEFDTWQDKIIAVTITIGSTYIIVLVLNKFLPTKLNLLVGIFNLLSGPLLIIGIFSCLAWLDPWPFKIIGMTLWILVMFNLPSFINRDKE
ncbi:hypothetical protein [Scandinavium goeteborgense]|uniref:hypothetical protein n=1 Tax=Scandinavium goeteborgense TaxID=1851514 RepID=UPI000F691AA6